MAYYFMVETKKGTHKPIEISNSKYFQDYIRKFKKTFAYSLQEIDRFTMMFDNEIELRERLCEEGILFKDQTVTLHYDPSYKEKVIQFNGDEIFTRGRITWMKDGDNNEANFANVENISEDINYTNIEVKLFGNVSIKNIKIAKLEEIKVVPVGKVIGLKMYTNGVLVVGMSEVEDKNNYKIKPYETSNIKPGDTILEVNKNIIEDIDNLKQAVNDSNGNEIEITILRNGNIINTNIIPVQTEESKYQLGLWVKDAATGVGTITFYEPESNSFGILGHGITDSDTNNLINIDSGELVTAKVISLKRGEVNIPGEIKGTIVNRWEMR